MIYDLHLTAISNCMASNIYYLTSVYILKDYSMYILITKWVSVTPQLNFRVFSICGEEYFQLSTAMPSILVRLNYKAFYLCKL